MFKVKNEKEEVGRGRNHHDKCILLRELAFNKGKYKLLSPFSNFQQTTISVFLLSFSTVIRKSHKMHKLYWKSDIH